MTPDNFVDQIKDIVRDTSCDVLSDLQKVDTNIKAVNYLQGTAEEIRATLYDKDMSSQQKYLKYPLIALITPFDETMGTAGGYYSKVFPKIAIVHHTDSDKKSPERYEQNINRILLPICEAFISALLDSGYYVAYSERDLKVKRVIRDDIGTKGFALLDGGAYDFIDAIELTDMELVRNYKKCFTEFKN